MRIPVLLGREIGEQDTASAAPVAVVNEAHVKANMPPGSPLGQRLTLPHLCPSCNFEVVGVAANALYGSVKKQPEPTVYLSYAQGGWGPVQEMIYELRSTGNPLGIVPAVRDLVQRADSRIPLAEVKTQAEWIEGTINQEIAFARLCTVFAVLALIIACVGLYGTMSYNVARRTSEIGIRMALGANRGRVIWMVIREVFVLAAAALAIGLPAAFAASKVVESFLFGMTPDDPLAVAGAVIALVAAALFAGYLPARNASRIAPMIALRHE